MTVTTTYRDDVACVPRTGTLYDVIDIILDRGMVIDVFLRVSLVGIEILKIDVRVVIASVDTYLRFAEACNRIDLEEDSRSRTVPELFGGMAGVRHPAEAAARKGLKKAVKRKGHKAKEALTPGHHRSVKKKLKHAGEAVEETGERATEGLRRQARRHGPGRG